MKCQSRTSVAAATFDAAKKLDTDPKHVPKLWQQGSERFDKSTTVRRALNMNGAEARLVAA